SHVPLQKCSVYVIYYPCIAPPRTRGGMRRLGVVENIAHDGTVLIRSEFAPSRGADVRDKRNRPLGRVVKVFGPVQEPFAAVRPVGPASLSLIGADVFVDEGNHANQEDRRGRRSHKMSGVQLGAPPVRLRTGGAVPRGSGRR